MNYVFTPNVHDKNRQSYTNFTVAKCLLILLLISLEWVHFESKGEHDWQRCIRNVCYLCLVYQYRLCKENKMMTHHINLVCGVHRFITNFAPIHADCTIWMLPRSMNAFIIWHMQEQILSFSLSKGRKNFNMYSIQFLILHKDTTMVLLLAKESLKPQKFYMNIINVQKGGGGVNSRFITNFLQISRHLICWSI